MIRITSRNYVIIACSLLHMSRSEPQFSIRNQSLIFRVKHDQCVLSLSIVAVGCCWRLNWTVAWSVERDDDTRGALGHDADGWKWNHHHGTLGVACVLETTRSPGWHRPAAC